MSLFRNGSVKSDFKVQHKQMFSHQLLLLLFIWILNVVTISVKGNVLRPEGKLTEFELSKGKRDYKYFYFIFIINKNI